MHVLTYDENNQYGSLGVILTSGDKLIITNQTKVAIIAWRGADINPGLGGGILRKMYNVEVKDDYQKVGIDGPGPNEVIVELKLER